MRRPTIEDFERHAASRGVTLLPHQRTFAEAMLASDDFRKFTAGGIGTGKTLTLSLLESFFELFPKDVN